MTYLDQCNERFQVIPGHTEIVDPKRSTQERTFVTLVHSHTVLVAVPVGGLDGEGEAE